MFGPLLEVAMLKKCTPLWREAHFEVKMLKARGVRTTFGVQMSLRVAGTRDCAPCQKWAKCDGFVAFSTTTTITTAIRYTTTATTPSLHSITLHYTPLHYTTLNYAQLHSITLHYTTLHYTTLHNNCNCNCNCSYTTLHYTTLMTLHHTTSH